MDKFFINDMVKENFLVKVIYSSYSKVALPNVTKVLISKLKNLLLSKLFKNVL